MKIPSVIMLPVNRIDVTDRYVKEADTVYIGIISKGSGTLVTGDETYPVNEGS